MALAAPSKHSSPLTQHISPDDAGAVATLTEQLRKQRELLLGTSYPPSDPRAAACSGLLLTPLLGVRMQAINRLVRCLDLTEEGASRKPALTA